jgi:hypothetical protein
MVGTRGLHMYLRGAKDHRTTRRETKAYAQTNGAVLCCAVLDYTTLSLLSLLASAV